MRVILDEKGIQCITVGPGLLFCIGRLPSGEFSIGLDDMSLASFETERAARDEFSALQLFITGGASGGSNPDIFRLKALCSYA